MARPKFTINGLEQPRVLCFKHAAVAALEEKLGRPIATVMPTSADPEERAKEIASRIGYREIMLFLWAGLLWENPHLTPDQAGELLDNAPNESVAFFEIGQAIGLAFLQPAVEQPQGAQGSNLGNVPAASLGT